MNAKEMFEKLDYKYKKKKCAIICLWGKSNEGRFITFNLKYKQIDMYMYLDNQKLPMHMFADEMQAIQQQIKELGWLDE